jgi:hypothetical protein
MGRGFHPLGQPTQAHLRGGATTAVVVSMANATQDAAIQTDSVVEAVAVEATASKEPMSALCLPCKIAAVLSAR